MPFPLFWWIWQTTKPKTRRGLLNENYSSQRARRWWAITSPLVPAAPARASPESTVARACAMASAYFLVWRLRSVELGLAASRVLQCTEPGVGQRAGGRDRVTGQGASCPLRARLVGSGVVWRQSLPSFTVHTFLRSRPLALLRQFALPSYRRTAPPAPVLRERDGVSASG